VQTTGDTSPRQHSSQYDDQRCEHRRGDTIYEAVLHRSRVVWATATANGTATVRFSNDRCSWCLTHKNTSVQVPLTITTLSGRVGTPSPSSPVVVRATGAATYTLPRAPPRLCHQGRRLSATSAGTCLVTAHQGRPTPPTRPSPRSPPRRHPDSARSTGDAQPGLRLAGRSSLSSADKNLLVTLSKKPAWRVPR